jgi:hypothetical protein
MSFAGVAEDPVPPLDFARFSKLPPRGEGGVPIQPARLERFIQRQVFQRPVQLRLSLVALGLELRIARVRCLAFTRNTRPLRRSTSRSALNTPTSRLSATGRATARVISRRLWGGAPFSQRIFCRVLASCRRRTHAMRHGRQAGLAFQVITNTRVDSMQTTYRRRIYDTMS